MKFYTLFKRIIGLKSPRMKLTLVAAARQCGMRYIGVFIDPVVGCNIRCKMCYFSDPAKRPSPEGTLTADAIGRLKKSVLPRAMKMQIGCGAEPTLYHRLPELIRAGKEAGVPYIEMTTNGQLLTSESIAELIRAGLDGITLSLHGTTKETYEELMQGASFDRLLRLIATLREIKATYPTFKLRVNYTVNNLNKNEILGLWELFDGVKIDVLQVRPIQKLGDTAYNDFEIEGYGRFVDDTVTEIARRCRHDATVALLPSKENVERITHKNSSAVSLIEEATYCYVSPKSCYRPDFDPGKESIKQYQHRSGVSRRLIKGIFSRNLHQETEEVTSSKKLNYS